MKPSIEPSESVGLLTDIVENAPIRIFWKDRDGRYLGCNTLFARDAGLEHPDQLIGRTDFDMGWKDQAELYRADDASVMDSGESKLGYEEPQTTPDGKTIWLRTSKVPLRDKQQKVIGILGIYEDITDRKLAGLALEDSDERLRLALSASNQAWFDLDITTGRGEVSPEYPGMLGYSNEEFDSSLQHWMASLHPEDRQGVLDLFQKGLKSSGPESTEYRRRTKQGDWIWMHTIARIIERDDAGNALRMVGIQADITERKKTEERLRASEQRFKDLFEKSPDPCWIINEANLFVFCNLAAADILGYDSVEDLSATHPSMLSPDIQPDGRESFEKANAMIAMAHKKGSSRIGGK